MIMKCILFAVLAGIVLADNAKDKQFPHQVSVLNEKKEHVCSGALLDKRWILTAANCMGSINSIRVGSLKRNEGELYDVEKALVHPQSQNEFGLFNLALMKTTKEVAMKPEIQTIALASASDESKEAWLSAWRNKTDSGLEFFKLKLISDKDCAKVHIGNEMDDTVLCTGEAKEAYPLYDDIGAPLVQNNHLVGIKAANSHDVHEGPAETQTPRYINIPKLSKWILDTMKNDPPKPTTPAPCTTPPHPNGGSMNAINLLMVFLCNSALAIRLF